MIQLSMKRSLIAWMTIFLFISSVFAQSYEQTNNASNDQMIDLIPNISQRLSQKGISGVTQHVRSFRLTNLGPNEYYEVRVSFLGSSPWQFKLSLPSASSSASRRLLDIDNVKFETDDNGLIKDCESVSSNFCSDPHVDMTLSWQARAAGDSEGQLQAQDIPFIIRLEQQLAPGVPFTVPQLLTLIAAVLVLVYRFALPPLMRLMFGAPDVKAQSGHKE